MIGIFGFNDLHLMQFLYKYTNILDEKEVNYDVVFWNRTESKDPVGFKGNAIAFDYPLDTYLPFWKKIHGFVKYSHFMRRQIKNRKYEYLIILTTQTAIPLYDLLTRKYKNKYIYDYRDITKEKRLSLYKHMVQNLIRKSQVTAVSSEGFLDDIGIKKSEKIIVVHNTQSACKKSEYNAEVRNQIPIRIVYWGMVRQLAFNKRVCDMFGNDSRFEVIYHGDGFYRELNEYCKVRGYSNIAFTGKYSTSKIPDFVNQTDILNCLYENDEIQKNAMPVKAYDAIRYRLPVIISSGSYVARFFENAEGALPVDVECKQNISDTVFSWIHSLNKERVEMTYQQIESEIFKDDLSFKRLLSRIIDNLFA